MSLKTLLVNLFAGAAIGLSGILAQPYQGYVSHGGTKAQSFLSEFPFSATPRLRVRPHQSTKPMHSRTTDYTDYTDNIGSAFPVSYLIRSIRAIRGLKINFHI